MNKGLNIFAEIISPKVNVIVWLEFKLNYFEAAVQHFRRYATGTHPNDFAIKMHKNILTMKIHFWYKMHWKWLCFKNLLEMILLQKCIRYVFTIKIHWK